MKQEYFFKVEASEEVKQALRKWALAFFCKEETFFHHGDFNMGYSKSIAECYQIIGFDVGTDALGYLIYLSDRWSNDLFDLLDRVYGFDTEEKTNAFIEELKAEAKEIMKNHGN